MEYNDLIRSRESIRNYDPNRPVPVEILQRILNAGRLAPSACNNQPWKFLVISSPEQLEKVRACYNREWFKEAPHILIVIGLQTQAWVRSSDGYNSIETDVAIALTHIILAAENEGIGSCWVEAYNPLVLRDALNLNNNQLVFGSTPLGYQKPGFTRSSNKKRRPLEESVVFL